MSRGSSRDAQRLLPTISRIQTGTTQKTEPQPDIFPQQSYQSTLKTRGKLHFKLKVNKLATEPGDMTTHQKASLNLMFYNFNQHASNDVVKEDENEDGQHPADLVKPDTCTDRLQSRNGSRRVHNRRVIILQ